MQSLYHQDERDEAAGMGCLLIIGGAVAALALIVLLAVIAG